MLGRHRGSQMWPRGYPLRVSVRGQPLRPWPLCLARARKAPYNQRMATKAEAAKAREEARERFLVALAELGDRSAASRASGVPLRTIRRWAADDAEFRERVADALRDSRAGLASQVNARILDVVLHGAPEIQTFKGQIQYELERHPDGQPILDPQLDEHGEPLVDDKGQVREWVPRLRLDAAGEPIPVVVRRYAEKTTLRLAESLEVLQPTEEVAGGETGKDVALVDDSGRRLSLVEALRARFSATGSRSLDEGQHGLHSEVW